MSNNVLARRAEMRLLTGLVGALVLLLLLHGRALFSAAWRNAGTLTLRDALLAPWTGQKAALALATTPAPEICVDLRLGQY
jgi:hypothetical protein